MFKKQRTRLLEINDNGIYNFENQKDFSNKQRVAFETLQKLVANILNDTDGAINFFTTGVNARFIPYYLIGLDKIPLDTSGNIYPSWQEYIAKKDKNDPNKIHYIKSFDDPETLMMQMHTRLYEVTLRASLAMSLYKVSRVSN